MFGKNLSISLSNSLDNYSIYQRKEVNQTALYDKEISYSFCSPMCLAEGSVECMGSSYA
jgi:hypothetical protein